MRIGIDIDGCINDQHDFILNYGSKYISDNKLPYYIKNNDTNDSQKIFGWPKEIAHDFWDKYRQKLVQENIRPFCIEVINKLCEEGNEIYIITSRYNGDLWWDKDNRDNVEDITIKELKKLNINYTDIIFTQDKLEAIQKYKIDIMLEDEEQKINKISKYIPVFIMDNDYNKSIHTKNTLRCYGWYDFYNKFHNFK